MTAPGGAPAASLDLIAGLTGLRRAPLRANGLGRAAVGAWPGSRSRGVGPPRWHTPPAAMADEGMARKCPHGNLNCWLAHIIPGPLALLALAQRSGIVVPGQMAAVKSGSPAGWCRTGPATNGDTVGGGDLLPALDAADRIDRDAARLRGKLLRYQIRMSIHPKPYGMFASVGLARVADAMDLALARTRPVTATRPDAGWLLGWSARWRPSPKCVATSGTSSTRLRAPRGPAGPRREGGRRNGRCRCRQPDAVRRALATTRRPVRYENLAQVVHGRPSAPNSSGIRLCR